MDAGLAYRTKGLCDVERRGRERGKGGRQEGPAGVGTPLWDSR